MTALELSTGVLLQEGCLPGIRDFIEGPDAVYGGKAFSLEFKDFIKVCLRPDPRERGTCESLLSHSLFALHHRNSSISETGLPMGPKPTSVASPTRLEIGTGKHLASISIFIWRACQEQKLKNKYQLRISRKVRLER